MFVCSLTIIPARILIHLSEHTYKDGVCVSVFFFNEIDVSKTVASSKTFFSSFTYNFCCL